MGVYIYTLRRNKRDVLQVEQGTVYPYKYSQRLEHSDPYAARQDGWCQSFMDRFPITDPVMVTEAGDQNGQKAYTTGSPVYLQEKPEPLWYDCDRIPGKLVGYLRRYFDNPQGKWVVKDPTWEMRRSIMMLVGWMGDERVSYVAPEGELPERLRSILEQAQARFKQTRGNEIKRGSFTMVDYGVIQDRDTEIWNELDHAHRLLNDHDDVQRGRLFLAA